ncbi:MAG: VOC family protein [Eubacteriales bacterium]
MMANIKGLQHIGLFVRDLEVSKEFYCGKLDFEVIHENQIEDKDGIIKIAFVSAGDCTIEIVQFPKTPEKSDGPVDHIAFRVEDIEKTKENLKARGIQFETDEIAFAKHFFTKGDKWLMFRGPDGEHLEINEIL